MDDKDECVTPRPLTNDEKDWLCGVRFAGDDFNGLHAVAVEDAGESRWLKHKTVVFKFGPSPGAHLYGMNYALGLTECQEHDLPDTYGEYDRFKPFRVYAKTETVTITTYESDPQ